MYRDQTNPAPGLPPIWSSVSPRLPAEALHRGIGSSKDQLRKRKQISIRTPLKRQTLLPSSCSQQIRKGLYKGPTLEEYRGKAQPFALPSSSSSSSSSPVRVSMDSHLWRDRQQQSEHQPPALALLAPEPSNSSINKAAVAAAHTPLFTLPSNYAPLLFSLFYRLPVTTCLRWFSVHRRENAGVGYFTLAQWQELELQALIYKYMLAGVSVPVELILPVRRSLLSASPYFHYPELYHHFQPSCNYPVFLLVLHCLFISLSSLLWYVACVKDLLCCPFNQQSFSLSASNMLSMSLQLGVSLLNDDGFSNLMLQTSYWGKCGIDPEPGRCRRTDGKKWRCSREVVVGQKYCERHVHRGRNRSRKHVEAPTTSSISVLKTGLSTPSVLLAQENHLNLPRPLATPNTHSLDRRLFEIRLVSIQSGIQTVEKNLQGNCPNFYLDDLPDNKPEGYVLQRFLDEWPKSQRENDDSINYAIHPASTTHLSISVPGNHSSDFSLKLSTGNPEQPRENNNNGLEVQQLPQPSNKGSGWVSHGEATMGGPLAEALRSSTSTHSPTSVLHKPNGSIYEISIISS
ncbi:hypothetical protein ZIOFF_010862 [Zingiber officinale]|uniref:Growth-regulating factor n=1 Tax=Zingiber officinale TaxID=94328 RepID=A0A8J5LSD0_ZINOF|nr:hypothetical protein ZIOFF_010862 [Zingiber officinale]